MFWPRRASLREPSIIFSRKTWDFFPRREGRLNLNLFTINWTSLGGRGFSTSLNLLMSQPWGQSGWNKIASFFKFIIDGSCKGKVLEHNYHWWNYIQGGSFNLIRTGPNRTGPSSIKIKRKEYLNYFHMKILSFKAQSIGASAGEFSTFFLYWFLAGTSSNNQLWWHLQSSWDFEKPC